MPNRKAIVELFLVSALGLFAELVFIRWVSSELRVLAFYKNLALLASYLGLGLGFVWHRRRPDVSWFEKYYFPLLAAVVLAFLLIGRTPLGEFVMLNQVNTQEYVWAGTLMESTPWISLFLGCLFYVFLFGVFLVMVALFILLGHLTASRFVPFRPLTGYTVNIAGSLTGIVLYAIVSFLGWPPSVWFLLSGAAAVYLLPRLPRRQFLLQIALAILPVLLLLCWPTGYARTVWSPYYRIDIQPNIPPSNSNLVLGYDLSVNQAWHQRITDLDAAFVTKYRSAAPEFFDSMLAEYNTPYQAASRLDNVLVVGAGTGNDVAGALRAGAKHVTAVEIDPMILQLGKELHPEHPYADPAKVTLVVDDARAFFRQESGKYDLIVFGLLDSHTLFASASSVRLDNYVYTLEGLTEARSLLAPDGLMALSFGAPPGNQWVDERLYRNLTDVFGHAPQAYEYPSTDILFMIHRTPDTQPLVQNPLVKPRPDYTYDPSLAPATDDWPYLYLQNPGLPTTYILMIIGILLISILFARKAMPDFHRTDPYFFLMGAAFFLLETKSITEMALLFGSTWIVNAAVIAAILVMILLANALVEWRKLEDTRPYYILLGLALLFDFFIPLSSLLGLPALLRLPLAAFFQALPLFFAGVIFAAQFRRTLSIDIALGSNMVGAVLGGLCEYASLAYGIRILYVIAFGFYACSAAALFWQGKRLAAVKAGS